MKSGSQGESENGEGADLANCAIVWLGMRACIKAYRCGTSNLHVRWTHYYSVAKSTRDYQLLTQDDSKNLQCVGHGSKVVLKALSSQWAGVDVFKAIALPD